MTPEEARRLLDLAPDSGPDALRAAYRARMRAVHPDHHGGDARATAAAAALNEAFRVLRTAVTAPAPPAGNRAEAAPSGPLTARERMPSSGSVAVLRPDGDSLAVAAPAGDVFLWVQSALHGVGEVTYVDPESGLLEAVVEEASGNRSSVVVTLQGRSDGTTEAFCSAERLAGTAPVDLAAIVDRIVDRLASGP